MYKIIKEPDSIQKIWKEAHNYFQQSEHVKKYDNRIFSKCRQDLIALGVDHLAEIEIKHSLPRCSLTMEKADNPSHTLRLLHCLDQSYAIAHSDTSIIICLYCQGRGFELKINREWTQSHLLNSDQMLVMYGVPGEIISNGVLEDLRDRIKCNESYAVAYFHSTPNNNEMQKL